MILGITGGMGCGKSAAASEFERHGFRRIDSDALTREQVLTSPAVGAQLRAHFGDGVIASDGSVERSDVARRGLEELTHPILFSLWREALASAPAGDWAVEVPLLFEKNLENWFDFTLCVAC